MRALISDTTPEMQQTHYEMARRLPASKRLALAFELTELGRNLILADLRHKFPQADEEEMRRRFISRVLPRADVIRVYGFDPQDEGY